MKEQNLESVLESVNGRMKELGLSSIPGRISPGNGVPTVYWDAQLGTWESFLEYATNQKVDFVIIGTIYGDGIHSGELGQISIGLITQGVVHSFEKETSWFKEDIYIEDFKDAWELERPTVRLETPEMPKETIAEFMDKSEDDLAEEITEYIFRESKDSIPASRVEYGYLTQIFLEEKGIIEWQLDNKSRLKLINAREKVKGKIEEEWSRRERETVEQVVMNVSFGRGKKD